MRRRTRSPDEPALMHEINTTPLIDVMLVLLVMLIVTVPIQLHAVRLALPMAATVPEDPPATVQIDIDAQSRILWHGAPVSISEFHARLKPLAERTPQPLLQLRADKAARYGVFAQVLASTRQLGLQRVAVVGTEAFAP
ncbi:MAG: biopolymer transporter ExbD [Rhodoferax sp.]